MRWFFDRGEKMKHVRHENGNRVYGIALKFMCSLLRGVLWRVIYHMDIIMTWISGQTLLYGNRALLCGMFWEKVKGKLVLCLLSLPQTPLSFSFLSSFSREKVDCYYFLLFLFVVHYEWHKNNDRLSSATSRVHIVHVICKKKQSIESSREAICNISNWRVNTKGILSCPCMSIYQRNM